MGLLVKLQNGDTALKSLKFGKDRPGGGDSGQPYIQNPIIESPNALGQFDSDFVLRGGLKAPISAAEDVARLTKYMFSLKNPSGLLFTAKQNLLSRVAPRTESSGTLNEGIYNPLSTLAQAGVGFAGVHLNKQGVDPTGLLSNLSLKTYSETLANQIEADKRENRYDPENPRSTNRLYRLYRDSNSGLLAEDPILREYQGGPGSKLGIGKTKIYFSTDINGVPIKSTQLKSEYAWSLQKLYDIPSKNFTAEIKEDFRTQLSSEAIKVTGISNAYKTKNIEENFALGNPGQKGDVSNYTRGKLLPGRNYSIPTDKITAYPIYKSTTVDQNIPNDIIPFNIAILDNVNESGGPYKKFIHFRAFIDSFSDAYSADWDKIKYMGRAESLYKYKGFNRDISLAFTVVAQSKDEMSVMYDKLNFLASSLAPEYLGGKNNNEYMTGNIAYLTVGDYIIDQPGIITSLTFDIPEESPWEISIDENGDPYTLEQKLNEDRPRRLPHMIKVTGFKFIPIHTFRPEVARLKDAPKGASDEHTRLEGNVKQKYIDPLKTKFTPFNSSPDQNSTDIDIVSNYNSLGFEGQTL